MRFYIIIFLLLISISLTGARIEFQEQFVLNKTEPGAEAKKLKLIDTDGDGQEEIYVLYITDNTWSLAKYSLDGELDYFAMGEIESSYEINDFLVFSEGGVLFAALFSTFNSYEVFMKMSIINFYDESIVLDTTIDSNAFAGAEIVRIEDSNYLFLFSLKRDFNEGTNIFQARLFTIGEYNVISLQEVELFGYAFSNERMSIVNNMFCTSYYDDDNTSCIYTGVQLRHVDFDSSCTFYNGYLTRYNSENLLEPYFCRAPGKSYIVIDNEGYISGIGAIESSSYNTYALSNFNIFDDEPEMELVDQVSGGLLPSGLRFLNNQGSTEEYGLIYRYYSCSSSEGNFPVYIRKGGNGYETIWTSNYIASQINYSGFIPKIGFICNTEVTEKVLVNCMVYQNSDYWVAEFRNPETGDFIDFQNLNIIPYQLMTMPDGENVIFAEDENALIAYKPQAYLGISQYNTINPGQTLRHSNYPNPFNPVTTISFSLEEASKLSLNIYNTKGQLVNKLISNEIMVAGAHSKTWDGKDSNGNHVASGIYFYKINSANKEYTGRMLLLK